MNILTPLLAAMLLKPVTSSDHLAGVWAGTVLNCYQTTCMSGFSWFEVGRSGRYTGRTIGKKPGKDCLSYDQKGWSGRLYRVDQYTYYAVNDGADEGYLLQVSPDRTQAASAYMGTEVDTVETNHFYRTTLRPSRLVELLMRDFCGDSR